MAEKHLTMLDTTATVIGDPFRQAHLLSRPLIRQAAGFLNREISDGEQAAGFGQGITMVCHFETLRIRRVAPVGIFAYRCSWQPVDGTTDESSNSIVVSTRA